jgi:NDP-sugar pyrophosphorylase family protein
MKAIILAGGMGVRLRPLTFAIPKPLIPVGEKPILEIIISKLKSFGIKDIILAVGYKSELIKTYFENGKRFGVNISYFTEEKKLGTAGPLRMIMEKEKISEDVLVMNGDILTELNFTKMMEFHKANMASLTVGIRKHEYQSQFGVIKLNGNRITGVEEKPIIKLDISAGIYIINPEIIQLVPENSYYDIPDLIKDCLKKNKTIVGYEIKEYWVGIEDIKNLGEAAEELSKNGSTKPVN